VTKALRSTICMDAFSGKSAGAAIGEWVDFQRHENA
jgi:hypothetical protein